MARAPTPNLDQTAPHICKFGAAFAINLLVRTAVTYEYCLSELTVVVFVILINCWCIHSLPLNDRSVITDHSNIAC